MIGDTKEGMYYPPSNTEVEGLETMQHSTFQKESTKEFITDEEISSAKVPIDDIVIKEQPGTERTHFKMPPNTAVDRMDCILAEIQERQQDFLTIICKDNIKFRASGLLLVAVSPSMAHLLKNIDLEDCVISMPDVSIDSIKDIFDQVYSSMDPRGSAKDDKLDQTNKRKIDNADNSVNNEAGSYNSATNEASSYNSAFNEASNYNSDSRTRHDSDEPIDYQMKKKNAALAHAANKGAEGASTGDLFEDPMTDDLQDEAATKVDAVRTNGSSIEEAYAIWRRDPFRSFLDLKKGMKMKSYDLDEEIDRKPRVKKYRPTTAKSGKDEPVKIEPLTINTISSSDLVKCEVDDSDQEDTTDNNNTAKPTEEREGGGGGEELEEDTAEIGGEGFDNEGNMDEEFFLKELSKLADNGYDWESELKEEFPELAGEGGGGEGDDDYKPPEKKKRKGGRKGTGKPPKPKRVEDMHKEAYCSRCGKHFLNNASLEKHNANVHEGKVFQCERCDKVLASKKGLRDHQKGPCNPEREEIKEIKKRGKRQVQEKTAYCSRCGKHFLNQDSLDRHHRVVHEGKIYKCRSCDKELANRKSLRRHERGPCNPNQEDRVFYKNKKLPPKTFLCEICTSTFNTRGEFRAHMLDIHNTEPPMVKCPVCNYENLTKFGIKTHVLRKHSAADITEKCYDDKDKKEYLNVLDKAAVCSDCGKMFLSEKKSDFKLHMVLHKSEKVDCNCKIEFGCVKQKRHHIHTVHLQDLIGCDMEGCWFLCNEKSQMFTHMNRAHNKEGKAPRNKIMCDLCGKEFEVLASLQKHKRYEHDTVLLDCVHCDKKFNLAKMKAHMFANHKNPGICGICGKKVQDLDSHNANIHVEVKRFNCDQCDRGFQKKSMLEVHIMNVHLKLRPYKCRYGCEFAYNNKGNRNSHERKKHGGLYPETKYEPS